jgi:hypothetical protein
MLTPFARRTMPEPRPPDPRREQPESSEFFDALKKGMLIGVLLLVLIVPVMRMGQSPKAPQQPPPVATAPQQPAPAPQADAGRPPAQTPAEPSADSQAAAPPASPPPLPGVRLADFNGEDPTPEARHVADWVVHSRDNKRHAFVIVDKKDARVYVFAPDGKLKDSAPMLLGSARGDDSYPGIGDKPLSAIKPHEKTTPAGRFIAEMGVNANHEDVVWVDYDAAVSMHRIRPNNLKERRLERLASLTVDDNRISFGCINLPVSFYENALSPAVKKQGAVIYVLPETRSPEKVFGSYDVGAALQQASARQDVKVQRVAARQAR